MVSLTDCESPNTTSLINRPLSLDLFVAEGVSADPLHALAGQVHGGAPAFVQVQVIAEGESMQVLGEAFGVFVPSQFPPSPKRDAMDPRAWARFLSAVPGEIFSIKSIASSACPSFPRRSAPTNSRGRLHAPPGVRSHRP